MTHVAAKEYLARGTRKTHRTHLGAHAKLHDHLACDFRGLTDVIARSRRRVSKHDFLSHAPAHRVREIVEQLLPGLGVAVLLRHHHRVAQGTATRKDRYLGDGVRVVRGGGHQGVSTLVVSRDSLVVIVHDASALLGSSDHTINGLVHGVSIDLLQAAARRQQSRFIEHVSQVCAGEARGAASE